MSDEKVYEVVSRISQHGAPLIGDCQMIAGSAVIEFKNGRAFVPESLVRYMRGRKDVAVVGEALDGEESTAKTDASPAPEEPSTEAAPDTQATAAASGEAVTSENAGDVSPEVLAAQEHLRSEGEEVPEVEKTVPPEGKTVTLPEGFQLNTDEGEPRCLAAKADGSQCANAAKEGTHACGIDKHQEAVAAL